MRAKRGGGGSVLHSDCCNYGRNKPDPAPITPPAIRAAAVTPGPDIPKLPPRPRHAPPHTPPANRRPKFKIDLNFRARKAPETPPTPARAALIVRPNPPSPRSPLRLCGVPEVELPQRRKRRDAGGEGGGAGVARPVVAAMR